MFDKAYNQHGLNTLSSGYTVLLVDDDPALLDLTETFLDTHLSNATIKTEDDSTAVLPRLSEESIDCIVSDYQMPRKDGLELLVEVRESRPGLPFILFTGRGSEEVASDAISRGVSDYLQKQSGTEQYELLANRVKNAVSEHRAAAESRVFRAAVEVTDHGVAIVDADQTLVYVNEAMVQQSGVSRETLLTQPLSYLYPGDSSLTAPPEDHSRSQAAGWDCEAVFRSHEGEGCLSGQNVTPIRDGSGKVRWYVIVQSLPQTAVRSSSVEESRV